MNAEIIKTNVGNYFISWYDDVEDGMCFGI